MANNNPQTPSQKPGQQDQSKNPSKQGQEWSDDDSSSSKPDRSRE